MDIEDREKDRDALHPALEELLLLHLIDERHRAVSRGDGQRGIGGRNAVRFTEEPETEDPESHEKRGDQENVEGNSDS